MGGTVTTLEQRIARDLQMFERLADHAAEVGNWSAHHDWLLLVGAFRQVLTDEGYDVSVFSSVAAAHQATLFPEPLPDELPLELRTVDPAIAQLSESDEGS